MYIRSVPNGERLTQTPYTMLNAKAIRVLHSPMPTIKGDMNPATARLAELYTILMDKSDVRFHSYAPGDVNGSYFEQNGEGHFRYVAVWQLVEKTKMKALASIKDDEYKHVVDLCMDLAFKGKHLSYDVNLNEKIQANEADDVDRLLLVKSCFEQATTALYRREDTPVQDPAYWDRDASIHVNLGIMCVLIGCGTKAADHFQRACTALGIKKESESAALINQDA